MELVNESSIIQEMIINLYHFIKREKAAGNKLLVDLFLKPVLKDLGEYGSSKGWWNEDERIRLYYGRRLKRLEV